MRLPYLQWCQERAYRLCIYYTGAEICTAAALSLRTHHALNYFLLSAAMRPKLPSVYTTVLTMYYRQRYLSLSDLRALDVGTNALAYKYIAAPEKEQ